MRRFELGGNARLRAFLAGYELQGTSIHFKYKTRAAEAYREIVG